MKLLIAALALISFGFFVPAMHADPTLTLNTQAGVGVLTELPVVGNVYSWTYVDDATNVGFYPGILPIPWSTTDNNVFSATFVYNPLGISVLNVTDVCANAALLAPVTPCSLDFSFSDTAVGVGYLDPSNTVALLGNLDIALGANIDISALDGSLQILGLDIGGGQAQIDFPPPPSSSPTPEPGTLSLMGTSLLGLAGVVRRKFRAA
jgi:hypothetical protein